MKKLIMIAVTAVSLGTASFAPAEAGEFRPRCGYAPCIHGIIIHPPHRVCVRWVGFGHYRHCVRWIWTRF
jgi:hypothetical protein